MSTHAHIDRIIAIILVIAVAATVLLTGYGASHAQSGGIEMGYEDTLFDTSKVHTIDIEMDDWDSFIESCTNEEYAVCNVKIDGEAYHNVAIRAKGNTSLSQVQSYGNDRYSFKIEFDHYDDSINYHGLDKLCLNNIIQDNTYMKDYLTYQLMGAYGVDSPLCSYVYITVNGEDWGLYLAVESVEESFMERNYGSLSGEMYKPDSMDMGGGRGNGRNFNMEDLQEQFSIGDWGTAGDADAADVTQDEAATPDTDTNATGDALGTAPDETDVGADDIAEPDNEADGATAEGADAAQSSEITEMPQMPQGGEMGEMPQMPQGGEMGEMPEMPQGGEMGEVPQMPQGGEMGEMPQMPQGGEMGEMPEMPQDGEMAEQPAEGDVTDETDAAQSGEITEMPQLPQDGEVPEMSDGTLLPGTQNGSMQMPGGMGSDDVSLIYSDDSYDSYSNIFNNAKTDITDADKDRLIASLKDINENTNIENAVDVEEVIRYFVVHNFVVNFDSYTGSMIHNYYLYEENGQLSMIPWDYNLAFGGFMSSSDATSLVNYPIDSPVSGGTIESRPMLAWIFESEEYTELYHQYFQELITEYFSSGYVNNLIEATEALIAPYVEKDPTAFCSYEEFTTGVSTLKTFCLLRAESIQGQLDGTIPSTSEEQQSAENLIDAANMQISDMGSMNMGGRGNGGGMQMPEMPTDGEMGETPEMPTDGEMGEMPEMPTDGEMGEMPEMPTGGEMGEMPEMPIEMQTGMQSELPTEMQNEMQNGMQAGGSQGSKIWITAGICLAVLLLGFVVLRIYRK